MRSKCFILFLFLLISPFVRSQEKFPVSFEYKGLGFNEFVTRCESQYPVRFFYNEDWIKNIKLGNYGENLTLTDVLDSLFNGTSIYYIIDDSRNILLTKDFAVNVSEKKSEVKQNFIPDFDNTGPAQENTLAGNLVVEIGNPADRSKAGNVVISGYVTNLDTKDAVPGATVFIPRLAVGTISNEYGFYSLSVPRGSYTAKYTFIGMKERTVDLNLFGSGELNIEMKSTLVPLKEAIVSADKNVTLQRFEVGFEKINIVSFRLMPTSMGESDIIKSILLLPGVQSVGEGSAGFNVRGGSTDQNLILLYGAPVYNASHFFGFFSAVNTDIIKDATLYKGGIPARYGGRISSVLDIIPSDGNRREFAGNAGISPITTHILMEGPIKKDTCFFIVAGRTTYSNWLFNLIENPALKNSRASFYDINARVGYDINRKNKLDLSAYYSHDSFKFNSDTIYQYGNNIFALRWRHFFNSRLFSSLSINNSFSNYDVSSQKVPQESFVLSHRINSTGLKADVNWYVGSRNEINFGTDFTMYDILPGSFTPVGDSSIVKSEKISNEQALESAVYFEDKYMVSDYLSVNAGVRFSSFYAFGPQTVYIYDPDYPKSISSLTDTINYRSAQSYQTYAGPELRISANFRISDKSSFKVN